MMEVGDVNLQPVRLLGEGAFGRVFLCRCRNSTNKEQLVCVKRIIMQNPKAEIKMNMEEVYILSQLKHPYIVQFMRSYLHGNTVNIVMEYMQHGTLRSVLQHWQKRGLPQSLLLSYFNNILMGLEYLHIRHVFHCDLKPENLLLDAQNRIKISDFGISAVHTAHKQHWGKCGTSHYMSPEVVRGDKYDFKSDVWSFGCILHEMCLGYGAFWSANNFDELQRLHYRQVDFSRITEKYGSVWANLCRNMLILQLEQRISVAKIICFNSMITVPYYKQYFDYKYIY